MADGSGHIWSSSLIAGRDVDDNIGSQRDLVDVRGGHLRLNHELIGMRHDQHDRFPVADYTPYGMNGKLMHHAAGGGSQIDPLQLVFGRYDTFPDFSDLALGFTQILEQIVAK